MAPRSHDSLRRFFAGLTEYAFFTRLGMADPPLVDYLAELLARFVRLDVVYRVRDLAGAPLVEVAEMLMEAEERIGEARREVHRHIGDFALFWTGVYPESLPRLQGGGCKDSLIDYRATGKRSYYIASTIPAGDGSETGEVLRRLSHQFETCALGLQEVRRQWEQSDDGDAPLPILLN